MFEPSNVRSVDRVLIRTVGDEVNEICEVLKTTLASDTSEGDSKLIDTIWKNTEKQKDKEKRKEMVLFDEKFIEMEGIDLISQMIV